MGIGKHYVAPNMKYQLTKTKMAASKAKFCNRENGIYYFEEISEVLNTCKNM